MPRKYEFEPIESNGREYVVAKPRNQTDDPVRLAANWIDGDEVEGEWQRAIQAIVKADLLESMELDEGNGRLSRREAVETLAAASDDEGPIVTSEDQADALLEYFEREDIVEFDEQGNVVILRDPGDEDINGRMTLNWAAAIDACIEKVTETMEQIDSAREKLEDRLEGLEQKSGVIDEKLEETAQELKSLGDGPGAPRDPSTLPAEEQQRFEELKRKLVFHKKMKEADGRNLAEQVKTGKNKLSDKVDMLEAVEQTFANKRKEISLVAVEKNTFPEDAMDIPNRMGNFVASLSSVGSVEEELEQTEDHEVADVVDDVLGDMEEVEQAAPETTTEQSTQETGELEM